MRDKKKVRYTLFFFLVHMRLPQISLILLCSINAISAQLSKNEEYKENLSLSQLPDGKLLAHFEFITKVKNVKSPRKKLKMPKK